MKGTFQNDRSHDEIWPNAMVKQQASFTGSSLLTFSFVLFEAYPKQSKAFNANQLLLEQDSRTSAIDQCNAFVVRCFVQEVSSLAGLGLGRQKALL